MDAAAQAAGWLAEAWATGDPLAPLPPEIAPRTPEDGAEIAALVLERLGLAPCGVRLAPGPGGGMLAGPMLEGRLIPGGTTLALAALRHARASAAVVAVLAEGLDPGGDGPPALAALHPALDVSASRFRDPPSADARAAADLGGLGQVVAGRRVAPAPPADALAAVPAALAPANRRPRGAPRDLAAALAAAAAAARRLGGLPAGALLVVAGLSDPASPAAGAALAASLGPLGRVKAGFA